MKYKFQKSELRAQKSERGIAKGKIFFCLLSSVFCLLSSVFSHAQQQEKFIYDPMGKRDPFVPLIDEKNPTGLRTELAPPQVEVKLPMEILVKGILWNGQEYFAIVNNEVMKEGQTIGKVMIKKIEQNEVILEYGEREFTILLRKE